MRKDSPTKAALCDAILDKINQLEVDFLDFLVEIDERNSSQELRDWIGETSVLLISGPNFSEYTSIEDALKNLRRLKVADGSP